MAQTQKLLLQSYCPKPKYYFVVKTGGCMEPERYYLGLRSYTRSAQTAAGMLSGHLDPAC